MRKQKDANRTSTRVQIVESVRNGSKVSQKIICHLGVAKTKAQLEKLMALAQVIREELEQAASPQQSFFTPKEMADLLLQKSKQL